MGSGTTRGTHEQHEDGERYARALEHMTEVLLTESSASRVLDALARITGETLRVDRSLIYDARTTTQEAVAMTEWLNPAANVTPTKGTYPLAAFGGGDAEIRKARTWLESHAEAPHEALIVDGAAEVLHGQMAIESLLWMPFDFREDGYYLLAFNQVTHRREWSVRDLDFLRVATRHAALALMQLELQAERAESQRALFEAQKTETIASLARGVAHDLGGLLGIVLGAVGRARSELGAASPHAPGLRDAERAARQAADLARHLVAYAGGAELVIESVDLAMLVSELQDLLRAAAGGVRLDVEVSGSSTVRGDAAQLRQIVMNFVVNAAEAAAGARSPEILVRVRGEAPSTDERSVVLTVSDNGRGMTDEARRRAFEPFFSTKGIGRGLGLAAVSGIVRAHEGTIDVESEIGHGTTFAVRFPAGPRARSRPPSSAGPRRTQQPPQTSCARRILLVDDGANFRRMCRSLLEDLGYLVVEAEDAVSALKVLARAPGDIDVVLLDWNMPRMSGVEALRRIRELRPDLPVVVMSGLVDASVGELARSGSVSVLEKPFTVGSLGAVLSVVVGDAAVAV